MKHVRPSGFWAQVSLWLLGASTATMFVLDVTPVQAQTTLPSFPGLNFQTSGPGRGAANGDWYTSSDPAIIGNPRSHEFFISITQSDLDAAGGSIVISVFDAESSGAPEFVGAPPCPANCFDEIDTNPLGTGGANPDPTRFQLIAPNGTLLSDQTVPSGSANNTVIAFPAIAQPGVYRVISQTGANPTGVGLVGNNLNDDDNGFRIQLSGGSPDLLIGSLRGTIQRDAPPDIATLPLFFLAGPDVSNLFLRNFDLDSTSANPPGGFGNTLVQYTSPSGGSPASTNSGAGTWNGNPGAVNTGGDSVPIPGLADVGRWQISFVNYNRNNQAIVEVNQGNAPGQLLPVFDRSPTTAGNFIITPRTELQTQIGTTVCHPFSVVNLFFTGDIINLTTSNPDPNYTVEFRAADGTTLLTDTDGDGVVDTGVIPSFGTGTNSRDLTLCVTPTTGAPPRNETTIIGTSFMERRVRQQAGLPVDIANLRATRTIPKITTIEGTEGASGVNLRLVKRITNVVRNGTVLPGVNFGAVIDDPGTSNDNAAGWSQTTLAGILALPNDNPVRSGDEVTYTVYFLSDGNLPVLDASICDSIPGGMTFIPDTLELQLANNPIASTGSFFRPLVPLPDNNSCLAPTNPNGATITNLGTVSNSVGSNFGLIRFRVRVN